MRVHVDFTHYFGVGVKEPKHDGIGIQVVRCDFYGRLCCRKMPITLSRVRCSAGSQKHRLKNRFSSTFSNGLSR
jgi:hypothetical protein